MKEYNIPKTVAIIAKTLEKGGFEAYLVGGCVRDMLIGIKPKDWDITTNASPEQIINLFPKTFYENIYGTVGVVTENETDETLKVVEVTPYREESGYSNRRHPDVVKFGKNLSDDLKRRDFTINAIALSISEETAEGKYKGHLVDIYKGQEDIDKCLIKTVGDPLERFSEDALRILRAIRISCELGFVIQPATKEAIKTSAKHLSEISRERIRDEFIRILMSPNPAKGLENSQKLGLIEHIIPEFIEGIGMKQNSAHSYDVWIHSLKTLQHAAKNAWPLEVRLAALFHDIGKIPARRWSNDKKDWTFHGHDVMGAKMTAKILSRLMFPVKTIDKVVKLVRWHMFFSDTDQITLSAVRRMLRNVSRENIWDLMNLRAADRIGTGRPKENPYRLRKYKALIEEVMHDPISVAMLRINGGRVVELCKIDPSPKVGHILHALLEEVMEDPKLNTKEYLEKRALELSSMNEKELEKIGSLARAKKEGEEERIVKKIRQKYWVS